MDNFFDTLKYNVEIDEQSLAEQLQKVRDTVDSSLGSLAFSSVPLTASSGGMGTVTPQGGFYAAPDISGPGPASPLAAADNSF